MHFVDQQLSERLVLGHLHIINNLEENHTKQPLGRDSNEGLCVCGPLQANIDSAVEFFPPRKHNDITVIARRFLIFLFSCRKKANMPFYSMLSIKNFPAFEKACQKLGLRTYSGVANTRESFYSSDPVALVS